MISNIKFSPFDEAASQLGPIKNYLNVPQSIKDKAQEIRLRIGNRISIEYGRERYFCSHTVQKQDIEDCISAICHYSVHCYEREFKEGFVTLTGGHRVGFCGTAVLENGKINNVKDITSINIRLARCFVGCGEALKKIVLNDSFKGLLIAGRPMSGKTTVLKDLCRIVGERKKIAIVDTRSEIGYFSNASSYCNVNMNIDILNGYPKNEGVNIAVKVLSPEYIFCDEMTGEEVSVKKCLNSGVKIIATIHAFSIEDVIKSEIVLTNAFSHIAFLSDGINIGQVQELIRLDRKAVII